MAPTLSLTRQVGQILFRQPRAQLANRGQLVRSFASEHSSSGDGSIKKMIYIALFCVIPISIIASNSVNLYGMLQGKPHTK
ncbi:hypothetical protein CHUAL_004498 [Chamberlinius hualienensis]